MQLLKFAHHQLTASSCLGLARYGCRLLRTPPTRVLSPPPTLATMHCCCSLAHSLVLYCFAAQSACRWPCLAAGRCAAVLLTACSLHASLACRSRPPPRAPPPPLASPRAAILCPRGVSFPLCARALAAVAVGACVFLSAAASPKAAHLYCYAHARYAINPCLPHAGLRCSAAIAAAANDGAPPVLPAPACPLRAL